MSSHTASEAGKKASLPAVIWLTPEQLAARLGVSESALAEWRRTDKGPRYRKLPGKGTRTLVRYKLSDVEAWEATWEVVDPAMNEEKVQAAYDRISSRA